MAVLTINVGSSSVRITAFSDDPDNPVPIDGATASTDEDGAKYLLDSFLTGLSGERISLISHRIVHGGTDFTEPTLIDTDVEAAIERLVPLAPLHNRVALSWIRACGNVVGDRIPQVAVFDTAFFSALPKRSMTYALPSDLCRKYGIRRTGFHGIAHKFMWERWKKLNPLVGEGGKIMTLQLGSGCSITATDRGKALDTSMGFSPLEGLVMSTRPGDIDPGILLYLQLSQGMTVHDLDRMVNNASGLLGLSGISPDMRILLESDSSDARHAIDVFCYRAKKYIGSYLAVLGGVNGIVFGGGIGEKAPVIRERILADMEWCGIVLDHNANTAAAGKEGLISSAESTVRVWVIPVDEAMILAKEAAMLIQRHK